MANSKYEYTRLFEREDVLLRNTWIVVRIDGRGFSKFSEKQAFQKPNDLRALNLMNAAATAVMKDLPDLILAYGVSDEYSFVFHKDTSLFDRRSSKLMTTVVSTFTAYYVSLWPVYFPDKALAGGLLPTFDGRCVCYPSVGNLRDYVCWRQVDCHINNQYNTTYWALRQKGNQTPQQATQTLSGTLASDKNEILFSQFAINYNDEPDIFKKGTTLYRDFELLDVEKEGVGLGREGVGLKGEMVAEMGGTEKLSKTAMRKEGKRKAKVGIAVFHGDVIGDTFWERRSWILSGRAGRVREEVQGVADGEAEVKVEGNGNGVLEKRELEVRTGTESSMVPSEQAAGEMV
ncbi:hypothetical protein Vi05172_g3850 [Venturia inaequalis]|nr:hypothetical protein Vi05172_g3850 [Venturia inaequalis]